MSKKITFLQDIVAHSLCSARRIAHTPKVLVSATLLLKSVWIFSLRRRGDLQGHGNVHARFVTISHMVQKFKPYRQKHKDTRKTCRF